MAVMIVNDGIGSGQAQAAALLLRGKIGVEDLLEIFFRYADPLILNGDFGIIASLQGEAATIADLDIFPGNLDGAALRHGLDGIDNEILEDLADLSRGSPAIAIKSLPKAHS